MVLTHSCCSNNSSLNNVTIINLLDLSSTGLIYVDLESMALLDSVIIQFFLVIGQTDKFPTETPCR